MKKLIIALVFAATPAFAQDRVEQYDFDKDGKVSLVDLNRFCTVTKSLFEKADKDSNGFLSNAEMRTAKGYLFSRCTEVPKEQ